MGCMNLVTVFQVYAGTRNLNAGSHIGQPGMKLMLYTNQAFMTEGIERTCLCDGNLVLGVLRLTLILLNV